jgi:8-oxo-dGTP pyrophosphatase MutT (NUDIX family)
MEILINGQEVPVWESNDIKPRQEQMVLESRIFQEWKNSLDPRFQVKHIYLQAVNFRGKASAANVLFVRMEITTEKPHGQVVELRGGTAVMLPIFTVGEGEFGQRFTVLVKQARLATGNYELVELPAGMIDGGTFGGAAARELQEELGVTFREDELVDLTPQGGIYLSPGLLDEQAKFYLVKREISLEELNALQGKATGAVHENEQITLWVVPLENVVKQTRDAKVFIALHLHLLYELSRKE